MPVSSLIAWLNSRPPKSAAIPPKTLDEIRLLILAGLADCGSAAERIRTQIRSVRSGADLMLLRGDIYQLLAREHCEAEARRRIDELLPAFRGWVPAAAHPRP